jgi:competence protein ComEC
MKRPLTGLVATYASGILVGSLVEWPVGAMMWWAAGSFVFFLMVCRTRLSLVALLTLVFASGILAYRHAVAFFPPNHVALVLDARDQNAEVRGTIVSDTGYRDEPVAGAGAERCRFELKLDAVRTGSQWRPAAGRLMVFVSEPRAGRTDSAPRRDLRYGDVIETSAILRVPQPAGNPGTFDWRAWLTRRGIFFTATIRRQDECVVLARDRGNPVTALSLRLRERFERALWHGLEGEPELAGVLAAIVIGRRSEIPADTYGDFQKTGVFHIFSVSGLNVALVLGVVVAGLRVARVPRRWSGLMAIPVLVLYVLATGARPASVRALVMATVWLGSWTLVRPADALNALAAAAVVILAWDPTQMFDGGFVLSFAAVASLVTLTPRIEKWLAPFGRGDSLAPSELISRWRSRAQDAWFWVARALSCSLAAWIGLLPLLAVYFNLFTPVSIVANVIVIPLVAAITALGMLAMPVYEAWPGLAEIFANANLALLSAMIGMVEWLARIPLACQFVRAPPLWFVAGYYAAGIALLSLPASWRRVRWAAVAGALVIGIAALLWFNRNEAVELTVLDLNDGVSIFLNAPGEGNDWLIDGGGDWSGERIIVPFLRSQGVDRLAAVVLTRGDKAHAFGFSEVAGEIPVGEAIHSGLKTRSKYYDGWLNEMRARKIPVRAVRVGDELSIGDRLRARVLSPPQGRVSDRSDDNALVLMLEYGPTRVLLLSDAGETVERRLLKNGANLKADIIVKGRHGEERSCTDAFLDAVQPATVVQIVGSRFSRRYPTPDLRERLEYRGIRLYRTDEAGAVTIRMTQGGHTIRTCLGAAG